MLRERMPSRPNPAGEAVRIPDCWDEILEQDSQRAALVPVALAALEGAHEIWRFVAVEPDGGEVEHQPHLIWCRPGAEADPEICLAGTRRGETVVRQHARLANDL